MFFFFFCFFVSFFSIFYARGKDGGEGGGAEGESGGGEENKKADSQGTKYAPPVPRFTHSVITLPSAVWKSAQRDLLLAYTLVLSV